MAELDHARSRNLNWHGSQVSIKTKLMGLELGPEMPGLGSEDRQSLFSRRLLLRASERARCGLLNHLM